MSCLCFHPSPRIDEVPNGTCLLPCCRHGLSLANRFVKAVQLVSLLEKDFVFNRKVEIFLDRTDPLMLRGAISSLLFIEALLYVYYPLLSFTDGIFNPITISIPGSEL